MKKFIINYAKNAISIVEVDCEKVCSIDDLSIGSLKDDEWKARINKPDFLYEKGTAGKLIKPIWCWHSFYDSVEDCFVELHNAISYKLLKNKTKEFFKTNDNSSVFNFDLEVLKKEVDEIIARIQIVYLN